MNTKLTVKAQNGRTLRCVLSNDANLEDQLEKILRADGGGLCVRIEYGEIRVVDYFHKLLREVHFLAHQNNVYYVHIHFSILNYIIQAFLYT